MSSQSPEPAGPPEPDGPPESAEDAAPDSLEERVSAAAEEPTLPPWAPVPSAAAWLAGCAAAAALGALCCSGGLAIFARTLLKDAGRNVQRKLEELATTREDGHAADAALDDMEDRLHVQRLTEGRFPEALSEPPPLDSWGTPLRYENVGPDAAWINSAGPDRQFDTDDDRVRKLEE